MNLNVRLPTWWDWIDGIGSDWRRCQACLEYNSSRCVSCEVPPGILAIVCLVGGGTATVAGNMRGNVGIHNAQQAQAAARVSGKTRVAEQLNLQANSDELRKLKRQQRRNLNGR